ncbi:MAG: hypothetical protein UU29_C0012G0015 [Candidatus Daviesbacteria bacterium GW2011_GWA2_40_9]|uniref:D-isomer specific 2-hydroxyacid dehydrogenase NAD-binding protein n=1 Tax=Candidatus Daviesbacteria bacterium GW2011_GWA2_40_9 TaxID=1618424 RepID=A0A0G0X4D8_9BACT|nr:MAG: hypothetical protein UU26_C0016G0015 [Candidatus Daviesbacteria bacterium GW2011_GWC1_40_9]KKR82477.1 MAG: hypothetical protein UU29_C0012G0015 [Candidatus Daviesbacteria bacterium GW2011_GWA2_40_9]
MKIGFFEITETEKKDYFIQNLPGYELIFIDKPLTEESLPQILDFDIISVFVNCQVTPKVITAFPRLRLITTRSTGFDNIDLPFAKSKNIMVANVPAYGSHTVAEYTFGLMLALSRKIYQAAYRVKVGEDFTLQGLRGFDLCSKTLGVIGTGKIGSNVVSIAQGFNMKVLAFDAFPNEELARTHNFLYTSLEELLKTADVVTLHTPYNEQTHHLINRQNIFLMKKGSLLINTARGQVVETEALFQALIQNHLGGAALDVLEEEKELKDEMEVLAKNTQSAEELKTILHNHILINLPQVIITPHMAFYSKEAEFAILETTEENIKSFLQGNPKNIVH